jgi:hypothetical protein
MKVYFPVVSYATLRQIEEAGGKRIAVSYYFLRQSKKLRETIENERYKWDIMLDSGAFSIFQSGKEEYDVEEYIAFLKSGWKDLANIYICFDVIDDMKKTLENYYIMREAGLNPLLVLQFGLPLEEMAKILEKQDYIGIPNKSKFSDAQKRRILRLCKEMRKKVHGFGIAAKDGLVNFPFFSIDCSDWNLPTMHGMFLYFEYLSPHLVPKRFHFNRPEEAREFYKLFQPEMEKEGVTLRMLYKHEHETMKKIVKYEVRELQKLEGLQVTYLEKGNYHGGLSPKTRIQKAIAHIEGEARRLKEKQGRKRPLIEIKEAPAFECSFCYIRSSCQYFKEGSNCALKPYLDRLLKKIDKKDREEIADALCSIYNTSADLVALQVYFMIKEGGLMGKVLIDWLFKLFLMGEKIYSLLYPAKGPPLIAIKQEFGGSGLRQLIEKVNKMDQEEILENLRNGR